MRALIIAAGLSMAVFSGGCQSAPPAGSDNSIAAPVPKEAALVIRADDADKTFAVAPGARIAVALVGVPTAGYIWAPAKIPAFLKAAGETGGPTHSDQLKPGFAGGSHWEVIVFDVAGPGEGELVMEQRRPWESSEPASATFKVRIVSK